MSKSSVVKTYGKLRLHVRLELVAVTCAECGMVFGIERDWRDKLVKSHGQFFCTNGHTQYFGYPEAKKNKKRQDTAAAPAAPVKESA